MEKKNMRSTSKTECRNNSSNSNRKTDAKSNSNKSNFDATDELDSN